MLYTLGRKRISENLVDLLLACHGRIRSFLELAVAIGEQTDVSDEDVAEASARVQRYFSEALPLHVEDARTQSWFMRAMVSMLIDFGHAA